MPDSVGIFGFVIGPNRCKARASAGVAVRGSRLPATRVVDSRVEPSNADRSRITELEQVLKNTRAELQGAIRSHERARGQQGSIQEELTVLQRQTQHTLDLQRSAADTLQSILCGTGLAAIFVDCELKIRFFTPATESVLAIVESDIGRPLAGLALLDADADLPADARKVLETLVPTQQEITTTTGVWLRKILPCRTADGTVEGVVMTFTEIARSRSATDTIATASREGGLLAAVSHDLRQPLQAVAILQGLLSRRVEDARSRQLVSSVEDAVGAMARILDGLWQQAAQPPVAGSLALPTVASKAPDLVSRSRDDANPHVIFLVEDDPCIREVFRALLEDDGRIVKDFASSEAFLDAYVPGSAGCLLIDAYLPGMGGMDLLQHLRATGDRLPAIMITGNSDVPMAVNAMKAGASDFIEKPISPLDLLASIDLALKRARDTCKERAWQASAVLHIAGLTQRQHQIMNLVLAGHPSKNIAADLGISQRTVENHRASIMKKTRAKSIPALARLALAVNETNACDDVAYASPRSAMAAW